MPLIESSWFHALTVFMVFSCFRVNSKKEFHVLVFKNRRAAHESQRRTNEENTNTELLASAVKPIGQQAKPRQDNNNL
jgi:hypothetical protein